MSDNDLSGRLFGPVMTRPRRPLSNSASTASWSMRFSLRMMISGARSSIRRFSRLFRLITARVRVGEVGRRNAPAVERHQGPKLGRDHWQHLEDHPLGLVSGLQEGLDDFEALDDLFLLLSGRLHAHLRPEVAGER